MIYNVNKARRLQDVIRPGDLLKRKLVMAPLGPYIADGFRDDCNTLLAKFQNTNSAKFDDFVKVWQEMKFSMIYCGLNTFAELLEFTEEVLCISKHLFLPPNSDISRIGALYLMYGLYTQQPTRGLVKIRMTPDDWMHTIDFIENVREYGYADANFVFHSLCYSAAFTFTAFNKEYGLERSYRRHQITSSHMREMMHSKNSTTNQILTAAFENIDMEELDKNWLNYENNKNFLAAKESQGMEFTSVTPSEDVVSILRKVVDPFTSEQVVAVAAVASSNRVPDLSSLAYSNSDAPSTSKDQNIGNDRQNIRRKAFKLKSIGQNHLKSCLSATEVAETEAPSTSCQSEEQPEQPGTSNEGICPVRKKIERNILRMESTKVKTNPTGRKRGRKKATKQAKSAQDGSSDDSDIDDPAPVVRSVETTTTNDESLRRSKRNAAQPIRYSREWV